MLTIFCIMSLWCQLQSTVFGSNTVQTLLGFLDKMFKINTHCVRFATSSRLQIEEARSSVRNL